MMDKSQSRFHVLWCLVLGFVMWSGSAEVLADAASILACRQIEDPTRRFACYEAIPVSPVGAVRPSGSTAAQEAASFGFPRKVEPLSVDTIESSISGLFSGWDPNDRISLANGQVWQIVDDSRGAVSKRDPKVKVRRGALGAFYLEIEGTNRSPKVKRIN